MKPAVASVAILLAAALGVVAGHGIGRAAAPPAPPTVERSGIDADLAAALRDLSARLEGIERSLAAQTAPARQEAPREVAAAAAAPAGEPMLDRLAALAAQLAEAHTDTLHAELRRARLQYPQPNAAALRVLRDRLLAEQEQPALGKTEQRGWLLHTMAEVIGRLGTPSLVFATQAGGLVWEYHFDDGHQVYLRFEDGLVIDVNADG